MNRRRIATAIATIAALLLIPASAAAGSAAHPSPPRDGFVTRSGSDLRLDGRPFRFAGTNNYYLMYSSHAMVDDVVDRAHAAGFTVLRTWGWLDIGNQDGSNSIAGPKNGIYFQYWDGTKPAYNDGATGLANLDYVIWEAGQEGIKLVIPFTNNWSDFGGMDQYVRWAGDADHDDFYSDPEIRAWYQAWISHLLNHVNPLTGLAYKNDPTIMTWELANEPRCGGSGTYPVSATCTTNTLVSWADTMSRYVKSIDKHHLVSVGDEGFECSNPASDDWTINCGQGDDDARFTALPAIDIESFHLYPDSWSKTPAWGTAWITQHVREAKRLRKAVMLGEFGLQSKTTRDPVYQTWTDAFMDAGGNGMLYWLLSGVQDDGTLYPDYDGFTVYCPSPVCQTMSNAEARQKTGKRYFPPVADNDAATTEFGTPVTVNVTADDIAYLGRVRTGTVDLDPATKGRQAALTTSAGVFRAATNGDVTFTPADGFHGNATATYTVRDTLLRLSNTATITVTVKPNPTAPIEIATFEDGVDGWAEGNWQTDGGTVARESTFATDGTSGLEIDSTGGDWFGAYPASIDLSSKSSLKFDIQTGAAAGTSTSIAVEYGDAYTWCQGPFTYVPQNTTTTYVADLTTGFSCDASLLTDVRAVFVFVNAGTFDIDSVRAE